MTRYEAVIEKSWRDSGIAQLLVARIRSDGRAEIGFFLLDLWCLGIKHAFLRADDTEAAFKEIISERLPEKFRERLHPSCAKKLIDGALAYAEGLGFAPHRDFRKARRALSGLDATVCPETFTFGREGKPCYVQGPNDDEDRVNRVLTVLKARCGEDGFNFVLSEAARGDEDEMLDARTALRAGLEDFGPDAPNFFEFAGLVAALHLCPTPVAPHELLAVLFGPGDRTWSTQDEQRDFNDYFFTYWDGIADLMAVCALAPADSADANPFDLYYDDFADSDPETHKANMSSAMILWCRGFLRATVEWPKAWGDALNRPELAPHWNLIRAWADPKKPENLKLMIDSSRAGIGAAKKNDALRLAVVALLCALRPPSPPPA